MIYKGKKLDVFKSDENIAFNPPRQMLVWDIGMDDPLVEYVGAFCPGRVNPVIINGGGLYQHCAEIPKSKTNWDEYQERRNVAKLSLKRGIEVFKEHDIPCIFCPAKQQCSNLHTGNLAACVDTFKAWATAEYKETEK